MRELDLGKNTHYRGEVIERIVGKIWNTRNEQLKHAIRALEPDFELDGETIPVPVGSVERLPNPIRAYEDLLSSYVNGSLSIIHGDLHLGNILLGPNEGASLIDFAHTRDGHTVFDWASLEISLLSEFIMPLAGENWSDTRSVLPYVAALNARKPLPDNNPELAKAFAAVKAVRDVANRCLAAPDGWAEYYIALVLCALRAITWETMKVGSRRLIFLVAALTIHELYERYRPEISAEDETDFDDSR